MLLDTIAWMITAWTLAYFIMHRVVGHVSCNIINGYAEWNEYRRRRFNLFALSQVNAIIITAYSVLSLTSRHVGIERTADEAYAVTICSISGYFLHDIWATRKVWMENKTDLIHHLLGIFLTTTLVVLQIPDMNVLIPTYGLLETSTIFLNIMWFERELGNADTRFFVWTVRMFVLTFFSTRIVWLPYQNYILHVEYQSLVQVWPSGPILMTILWLLAVLQFYWFALIIRKFVLYSGKGKVKDKE